ncbi:MAG: CsgG/HfaB family protein, partial [Candidatus Neomarinimicrobiota bacterium]
ALLIIGCGSTRTVLVGNEQVGDTYSIAYRMPPFEDGKRNISVLDFVNKTQYARRRLGSSASDILSSELVKLGSFNVIEREQLTLAIQQLDLADLGLIDPSQAVEVGKYLGTHIIVTGSVSQYGSKIEGSDFIFYQSKIQTAEAVVDARLIDVQTTEIIGAYTGRGLVSKTTSSFMGAGGRAGYDEILEGEALRAAIIDVVRQIAGDEDIR